MRLRRAYSLLELLLVLAIAGLLITLIPPMFSKGASSAELKASARGVVAGVRSARSQAISQQKTLALRFDLQEKNFRIEGNSKIYRFPSDLEIKLELAQSAQAGKNKDFDDNIGVILFFPDGSSSGGRVILGYGERQYVVDIAWLSGQAKIVE